MTETTEKKKEKTSMISGLYQKNLNERHSILKDFSNLDDQDVKLLSVPSCFDFEIANKSIENFIGIFPLPMGIAPNFRVNNKDYVVPMVTEEPSVIAAASNGAKLSRLFGGDGFTATSTDPIMIGQIQVTKIQEISLEQAKLNIEKNAEMLVNHANETYGTKRRSKAKTIVARVVKNMLVVHLLVNVCDSMGANTVNTMVEALCEKVQELTKGIVLLRIISNLPIHRTVTCEAVWTKEALEKSVRGKLKGKITGEEIGKRIIEAWKFAEDDPFRRATHIKGILNGIDAVAIATGNDFRATSSGLFSLSNYHPNEEDLDMLSKIQNIPTMKDEITNHTNTLTSYYLDSDSNLHGKFFASLSMATFGGSIQTNPMSKLCQKILNCEDSNELSCVTAAVGLAQNFAALRSLVLEGIQRGHMKLHKRKLDNEKK
ncbi:3-hydroxy-3-methylglutaryl-coenzyme a reductase [Anaeramoeba flamelloides]|uniref:hydroxymethylglutaryl-CoA reductase (NADPH) n=1 Tax=Anaeramoeba flamelloides TaxID=1746091 RepID=A0ABQ8XYL3_9EUKA|nr:3-hydroxy-3-methylglutaryl-coenzyme a reductase [Anaeramoeba flamelloides]